MSLSAAIDALKTGKDVSAAYGSETEVPASSNHQTPAYGMDFNSDAFMQGDAGDTPAAEATPTEPSDEVAVEASEGSEAPKDAAPKMELEVDVTDDKGRRKLKVDLNDHEKLKKYIALAAGARKWQVERDSARNELKGAKAEAKKLSEAWSSMQQAYDERSWAGVMDLIAGKQGAFEEYIQKEHSKRLAKQDASPAELERIELQERLERLEAERSRELSKREKLEQAAKEKELALQQREITSTIEPAFLAHSFSGKLGDPTLEQELDEAVWIKGIKRIEALSDDEPLTRQTAQRIFGEVAATFKKAVATQAEKQVDKTLASKKKAAQESAAISAIKATQPASAESQRFRDDLRKGDFSSALKSLMTGKIRL